MQPRLLGTALLWAGLLAACGGGGGGSNDVAPPPAQATASFTLAGTAAKGLMAHAVVSAHAVRADGSLDEAPLASTVTDGAGRYAITFAAAPARPHVIRVRARDDGRTTHLDEASGQWRPLPPGFVLRALLVPAQDGRAPASLSVTPLSEMAVAAAEKAPGGFSADNVAQARSTLAQLLGFDPAAARVQPADSAQAGDDDRRLAVLLTAVSQLAAEPGALGCADADHGRRTQCVVSALGRAASTTTLRLADGATDVSGALASAVGRVLDSRPELDAVPRALLAGVQERLACRDGDCAPVRVAAAAADPLPRAAATVRGLLDGLRSGWAALFAAGTPADPAAIDLQALPFQQAMDGVQGTAELLTRDAGALLAGIGLLDDFRAGRTDAPHRVHARAGLAADDPRAVLACTLYQDAAATVVATGPAQAGFVACRAAFPVAAATPGPFGAALPGDGDHHFTLSPAAPDGAFTYRAVARRHLPGTTAAGAAFEGRISTQRDGAGRIAGFAIEGALPGTFDAAARVLPGGHHTWRIAGTRTADAADPSAGVSRVAGEVAAWDADGRLRGTLQVRSGEWAETPAGSDAAAAPTALDVAWSAPGAAFEGSFSAEAPAWDRSLTALVPTRRVLAGALRHLDAQGGTVTLTGVLEVSLRGVERFDRTQPASAANHIGVETRLRARAAAPGQPPLALALAASHRSHEREPQRLALHVRGAATGLDLTVGRDAAGLRRAVLHDGGADLSLALVEGARSADLLRGDRTVVGRLELDSGRLSFGDGRVVAVGDTAR